MINFSAFAQNDLIPFEQLEDEIEFKDLESAMQEPKNVIRLNLKGEKIATLPYDFDKFVNLQYLDLSKKVFKDSSKASLSVWSCGFFNQK